MATMFSCSKGVNTPSDISLQGTVLSDQSYTGFLPLTLVAGQTNWYTQGTLEFQLPTTTLPYWNGEPVTSYSIAAVPGGTVLNYNFVNNGGFVAYLPAMGGVDVNALSTALWNYDTAWSGVATRDAIADTSNKADTAMLNYPVFSGYLTLLPFYATDIKYAGFVVRDHNSPSTYSIAPSTFKPVQIVESITELGTCFTTPDNGYYELAFYGDDIYGTLTKVNWFAANGSGTQTAVISYKLTVVPNSKGGFILNGTVTIVTGLVVTLTNVLIVPGVVV